MTEPTKRKAPAKPRTRKPAAKPIENPETATIPGEVVEEDQSLRVQLVQRSFDQSDVALEHLILGGQDPLVLIQLDMPNKLINVDATLFTIGDLQNLFTTLATQLGTVPERVGDKKFI